MSLKKASFLDVRSEVLEFFRDQEVGHKRKGVEVRAAVVDVSSGDHSFCPEVSVVTSKSNSNSSNEIDEIKNSLCNLSKQVAALTGLLAQMKVPSRVNEVTCYNCGQKGHTKPQCTEPPLCYGCKGRGHMKKDCPISITVENPAVRVSRVGRVGNSVVDGELAQRLIYPSPRGTMQIAGIQVGCVFDTGAETSVIPSSVFHSQLEQKLGGDAIKQMDCLSMNVVGIGGLVPIAGYVEVPVSFNGQTVSGSFLVTGGCTSRSDHPVVIGRNILRKLDCDLLEKFPVFYIRGSLKIIQFISGLVRKKSNPPT